MSDELLLEERESLRQMLVVAANDLYESDRPLMPRGAFVAEYLHDLRTRDFFEEIGAALD